MTIICFNYYNGLYLSLSLEFALVEQAIHFFCFFVFLRYGTLVYNAVCRVVLPGYIFSCRVVHEHALVFRTAVRSCAPPAVASGPADVQTYLF